MRTTNTREVRDLFYKEFNQFPFREDDIEAPDQCLLWYVIGRTTVLVVCNRFGGWQSYVASHGLEVQPTLDALHALEKA